MKNVGVFPNLLNTQDFGLPVDVRSHVARLGLAVTGPLIGLYS